MKVGFITPIGPGHKDAYEACRQSIEVAWGNNKGRFAELEILPMWDLEGKFGRSSRRNAGIDLAIERKCDWIFFLDADDLLSQFAFEEVAPYLDHYDAIWGNICEMPYGKPDEVKLRENQLQTTESIDDLLKCDPFLTLQMGHFVKTECANAVRFDSSMNTGEDFKYYLQICRQYKFIKFPGILFINQRGNHSQGPLSASGREWMGSVQQEIRKVISERVLIAKVSLDEQESSFRITNPFDIIQAHWCRGLFFEQNDLLVLKKILGENKVIVDIGANVGNHTVFFAHHMKPKRIYPFEPNPESVRLLKENVELNDTHEVIDTVGIGIGLGSTHGNYSVALDDKNNLGAARLVSGGGIKVKPLDVVIPNVRFDFMKIDVEGMEFEVLLGAQKLIALNRPLIYVEVFNESVSRLDDWLEQNGYASVGQAKMVNAINCLIAPKETLKAYSGARRE